MSLLIVGGAGYIGSHVNKLLSNSGYRTIVYDNLSCGHREVVKWGRFVQGDVGDGALLNDTIRRYGVTTVFHFASYINVAESVLDPAKYYQNNLINTLTLLETMRRNNCRSVIFSSSCATYGEPDVMPITEDAPQNPVNPYGFTKLAVERIFRDYAKAYGLRFVALRYFNAAGADPEGETGEWHEPETHIIPRVLDATGDDAEAFTLYGTDYPTRDGTCIRDYIHVSDLAEAHLSALRYLDDGNPSVFLNLGNTGGTSNLEIIRSVRRVTGRPVNVKTAPRRPGDAAVLVGNSERAKALLGWEPKYTDIDTIVAHAWAWRDKRRLYDAERKRLSQCTPQPEPMRASLL